MCAADCCWAPAHPAPLTALAELAAQFLKRRELGSRHLESSIAALF